MLLDKLLMGLIAGAVLLGANYFLSVRLSGRTAVNNARVEHLRELWVAIYSYGEVVQSSLDSNKAGDLLADATQAMDKKILECGIFLGRERANRMRLVLITPLLGFAQKNTTSRRKELESKFMTDIQITLNDLEDLMLH